MEHKVYQAIVEAAKSGRLAESFGIVSFREVCPGFGDGTYRTFLSKHRKGNGKTTELFMQVSAGRYRLLRPLRYQK